MITSGALLMTAVSSVFSGSLTVSGELWFAECSRPAQVDGLGCGVPQKIGEAQSAMFSWSAVQPGAAFAANQKWNWESSDSLVEIYAVHPHEDSKLPPHVQIKLSITRPVEALCTTTVEYKASQSIPPLVCASTSTTAPRKLWGLTLKGQFE